MGPSAGLSVADEIASLDLAGDDSGTLHAVWNAALEETPGTLPRHVTFASRGRLDAASGAAVWSERQPVGESLGPVRIAAAGGELHLVCGPTLRHFVASSAGGGWREAEELLPAGPGGLLAFDLAVVEGAPLVAYLRRPKTPYEPAERGPEHEQELVVVRAGPQLESVTVARSAPTLARPVAPRLLQAGGRLHLLAGFHEDTRREQAGRASAVAQRGQVRYFASDDGGQSWKGGAVLAPAAGGFEPLRGLALASTPRGLLAFMSAHGVFAARSVEAATWSPARRINPYEVGASGGTPLSLAVAAAARGAEGRVVWIDQRYRHGEGSWLNPLGGVPWSDDTRLWSNNDLFALRLEEVDAALRGAPVPAPIRLTPHLSFVGEVRLAAVGDRTVILWAGRRKVGKQITDAGEPPAVFLRSLPAAVAAEREEGAPRGLPNA